MASNYTMHVDPEQMILNQRDKIKRLEAKVAELESEVKRLEIEKANAMKAYNEAVQIVIDRGGNR